MGCPVGEPVRFKQDTTLKIRDAPVSTGLVQNLEFLKWPQFNSGIGIEFAPPPQDVEFEFELELQEVKLNSWQFNEMSHSHAEKECVESYIGYSTFRVRKVTLEM